MDIKELMAKKMQTVNAGTLITKGVVAGITLTAKEKAMIVVSVKEKYPKEYIVASPNTAVNVKAVSATEKEKGFVGTFKAVVYPEVVGYKEGPLPTVPIVEFKTYFGEEEAKTEDEIEAVAQYSMAMLTQKHFDTYADVLKFLSTDECITLCRGLDKSYNLWAIPVIVTNGDGTETKKIALRGWDEAKEFVPHKE